MSPSGFPGTEVVQVNEHGLARVVDRAFIHGDLIVRLPFTSKPFRSEEPSLVRRNRDIPADGNPAIRLHGELHLIALADVQDMPDFLRQGELRLLAEPYTNTSSW
jgi:hypothetical protein